MEHEELTNVLFVKSKWSEVEEEGESNNREESHYDVDETLETRPSTIQTGETVSYVSAGSEQIPTTLYHETEIGNIESEKVLTTINYDELISASAINQEERFGVDVSPEIYEESSVQTPEDFSYSPVNILTAETSSDERKTVSHDAENDKVKVLFRTDTEETMTSVFTITSTIRDIKTRLSQVFKISIDDIELIHETIEYDNAVKLLDLTDKSAFIEFDIRSKKDEYLAPGEISQYSPVTYTMIITVPRDVGESETIRILVENQNFVKEWLGGYRNRITHKDYHHALVQTLPRKRPDGSLPQRTRQTQTPVFPLKETADDTASDKVTQMWRLDHYIGTINDRIIATDPARFQSAFPKRKMTLVLLINTIVKIKRVFRTRCNMRRERIAKEWDEHCMKLNQEAQSRMQTDLLHENENLIVGCTFPVNRGDFYLLYQMLGNWWRHNENQIKRKLTGSARKVALLKLLERETELIRMIEKQRINVKHEILKRQEMHFLDTCARPVIFRNNRGFMSSVDTLETQQSREYLEIISCYINTAETATVEERIDILCTLKHLIKSYDHPEYDREMIDLLERECDLLAIDVKSSELKMLRERIKQLLLYYLHFPIINPSCKNYRKLCIPRLDEYRYLCTHCRKLKLSCDYNLHVKLTSFDTCHSCEWMKNIGQERFNLTPFARMLNYVRQSELVNCCYASVAYVLQIFYIKHETWASECWPPWPANFYADWEVKDPQALFRNAGGLEDVRSALEIGRTVATRRMPVGMSYLVTKIWRSKSILSDATDMNRLRMVRFRNDEDWSPWNCILLTVEEAYGHSAVKDVYTFYSRRLINRIHWRHMRAKNHFLPLLLNDRFLRESKMWFDIQDRDKFLYPAHVNEFARTADFEYIQ